ncbi:NAD(P)-binding protein [Mollisia scopiformis]|uniref:NAD(P)-binding protein n=1 Tax=Mollisia scopiformis TaxID=149040 RepID=A0A194XH29_MOLSC|nr:NAD(P)-binding protein [Mollisia scopiformis]KUJ19446.1 NAD(P)-binding protein [Mollisia scopiformis]
MTHIQNIAIMGATGNLGSLVVKHLLQSHKKFNITAITRSDSTSTLPDHPSLIVKKGDYSSPEFLASAFAGQEAVIFTLYHTAVPEQEVKYIEAAAAAGVKWILPVEFGGDNAHPHMSTFVPVHAKKTAPRKRIEELSKTHEGLKWIGVVTNPWFDFAMERSMWGIDIKNRTANLMTGNTGRFNTTNLDTVALATARIFNLPIQDDHGPSLDIFGNRFVYVSSFHVTQQEIFSAVQRVTGTTDADWKITRTDLQTWIDEGAEKLSKGQFMGMVNLLMGTTMQEGGGGDFESKRGPTNKILCLPEEDLDESVSKIVDKVMA